MKKILPTTIFSFILLFTLSLSAQNYLLKPDRVFDGEKMYDDWVVLVQGEKIIQVGLEKEIDLPPNTETIRLKGQTLLPGLIEGHSHVLLHPYDETSWNDQVLKESRTLRVVRATVHVKNTLMAGFTTIRDLGSEGADYADVGIKKAIDQGIIPGPRMQVAGRAIVATGSYGPKGFHPDFEVPLGAEPTDGNNIIRTVRDQIGKGADFIKVYADYRWGPNGEAMPTFSQEEIELMVKTAASSGRPVVAHAATAEGMRRATMAGVLTIEHGDGGTPEVFQLMAEKGVALCPTLAAGDAIMQYRGWKKGEEPEPARIANKRKTFAYALEAGVPIVAGGDVGVFTHGDNARELEMMVEYGMEAKDVLQAATQVNARYMGLENQIGTVKAGLQADLISVEGNPLEDISVLKKVKFVMKGGTIFRKD